MSDISVNIVLDKSSSMSTVEAATISGFNEYLDTLRKDRENTYKVSLTLFNESVEHGYTSRPLEEVKPLTKETYSPNGMTALYDAACETIDKVRHGMCDNCRGKTKNIVVILTDGQENSSRKYTQQEFRRMVEMLQKENNWTFVFLGANQDAWAAAQNWGFHASNVSSYQATARGVNDIFQNLAANTVMMASSLQKSTANFFSAEQKDQMEGKVKGTTQAQVS